MDLEFLRRELRRRPLHKVVGYYLYQAAHRLFGLDIVRSFCRTPSSGQPPAPAAADGRCERLAAAKGLEKAAHERSGMNLPDATARLAANEECFGVYVDGVLASQTWFSTRPAPLRDGINVRFDS